MAMESLGNIVNATDRFKPSLDNDSGPSKRLPQELTPEQADRIAGRIQARLKPDSNSWKFYCLVAYSLPQSTIDRLVDTATEKGRNPAKLFCFLATKEMGPRE